MLMCYWINIYVSVTKVIILFHLSSCLNQSLLQVERVQFIFIMGYMLSITQKQKTSLDRKILIFLLTGTSCLLLSKSWSWSEIQGANPGDNLSTTIALFYRSWPNFAICGFCWDFLHLIVT